MICALLLSAPVEQTREEGQILVELYEAKFRHHGLLVQRARLVADYHADLYRAAQLLSGPLSHKQVKEAKMLAGTSELDFQTAQVAQQEAGLRLKVARLLLARGAKVPVPDTDDESLERDETGPTPKHN